MYKITGDIFLETTHSRGPEGDKWLKDLPNIIKKYESLWGFKTLKHFKLSYNFVAPVKLNNGKQAVLKISFPTDPESITELKALQIFNCRSSAKLINVNYKDCVSLLELISPGMMLSSLDDDNKATKIFASVCKNICHPLPKSNSFITIKEWSTALVKYNNMYKTNGPLPKEIIEKAITLLGYLESTSKAPVLLHGDLHHDNILYSIKKGWVAIDPKGVAAEPVFEVAAMIQNPANLIAKTDSLSIILNNRVNILSEELGYSKKRIIEWCFYQTVLSSVWALEDKTSYKNSLKVALSLREMLQK